MSDDHKNIDPFYKENLEKFSVSPPDHLWEKIEAELPQNKKKRSVLIWLLPTGIAASLFLMLGIYIKDSATKEPIQVTEIPAVIEEICPEDQFTEPIQNASTNSKIKKEVDLLTNDPKKPITIQSKTETDYNSAYANNSVLKRKNNKEEEKFNNNPTSINELSISNNTVSEKKPINLSEDNSDNFNDPIVKRKPLVSENTTTELKRVESTVLDENTIKNQISQSENINDEEKKTTKSSKNWSIQPQIAPLVYDSYSGGSPIAQNFADNDQSTKTDLSYGIKIAYQFSNKLSIRTGVSTASVNIVTNEVGISTNDSGNESFGALEGFAGITDLNSPNNPTNNSGGGVGVKSNPPPNTLVPDKVNDNTPVIGDTILNGSLVQDLNYIEIPLELAYQLIDKRIGLQLIGGMSTLILSKDNDQVFFRSANQQAQQGTTNNLNRTSFSGNFGVGMDYSIAPNLKISIEPVIKVQFNAFNNNTDFNPYFFGIYSGIKFRL